MNREKYLLDIREIPVSDREAWLKLVEICSTEEIKKLIAEAIDFLWGDGAEVFKETDIPHG